MENFKIKKQDFIQKAKQNIKDEYKFKKEIGSGAFGVVFLAEHKISKEKVAVKALAKAMIGNQEAFSTEIAILKSMDHPNIVKLHEIFESETTIYIVMEHCEGGELLKFIAQKQHLTEGETAKIVRQCISAVSYLHSNNIAHRDLKPENFLLKYSDNENSIKLIDFGFSKKINPNEKFDQMLGTPLYIAPEVIEGGKYDFKVDCWAIGVILYILLSGSAPFYGKNTQEILKSIQKAAYTFDLKPFHQCSDEVKDLIAKLMQKNPKKRYSSEEAYNHIWVQSQVSKEIQDIKISEEVFIGLQKMQDLKNMKKTMLMYMATQIPENKIEDLRKIFLKIDENGNGMISLEELLKGFNKFGPPIGITLDEKQLTQIFKGMDFDNSGQIEYTEFIASFVDSVSNRNEKFLKDSFKKIDKDQSGKINRIELQELLNSDTIAVGDGDIAQMIKEADNDGDGEINYEEFVQLVRGQQKKKLNQE